MKKYSEVKKKLVPNGIRLNDGYAYLTHYLQNHDQKKAHFLKEKTAEYFRNTLDTRCFFREITELLPLKWDVPFPPPPNPRFRFIDLFAGVGGFRIAFQSLGGKCVFSSEIDEFAKRSYEHNFGEVPFGDIRKISEKNIIDHEILLAGFPCQAFSIAGRRKGFEDTRGTLFHEIARIIKEKKPLAFFLENVKGLMNHDKGETLKVILEVLRDDLGYWVPEPRIMNAKKFGVPQNRERIFIVGFRNSLGIRDFEYPDPLPKKTIFKDVKESKIDDPKYFLSTKYWETLKKHKARHANKGNGFGYEIIADDSVANAIVVGGMGRERNLVIDKTLKNFIPTTNIKGEINGEGIRRMTPREWARLQGFPDNFKIVVSDAQAYKQFGNSVAIPAIKETGKKIVEILSKKGFI